jgi:NitT/TauT family transport system permease protein
MTSRITVLPMWVALLFWFLLWEIVGRLGLVLLIPPFSDVVSAMFEVVATPRFASAAATTLQAFGIGMGISIVAGVALGVAMGRSRTVGEVMGMWANIFESSPLSAVVPLLMAVIGFGMPTMVVTVVLFSIWVIALDTQVGVRHASTSLVEMAHSFGARKRDLYGKIVFWAALPEILAGIRLGLIRGVKGVIIGQLLIAIVGVGYLFELYSRNFLMPEFWALILMVFAFAYGLGQIVGLVEKRIAFYAGSR